MTIDRDALSFWVDCYKAGVRITMTDGRLYFWRSPIVPVCRIEAMQAFGVFPDDEPVAPQPWMVDGVREFNGRLTALLSQNPPKQFARFFYHLLVLEHEAQHIERAAMAGGHDVRAIAVNGGQFLVYGGKREPVQPKDSASVLPAILSNYRGIAI